MLLFTPAAGLLRLLLVAALLGGGQPARAAADARPAPERKPDIIRVVTVDQFPPLSLRTVHGELRGSVRDLWELWSARTGIQVELRGMDWPSAIQEIRAGRADVITPIIRTAEREREFDFSPAYYQVPVRLYHHQSVSGLLDAGSSKGLTVGVGSLDPCADRLREAGSDQLKPFARFDDMVEAASRHEIRVFCGSELLANYHLKRYGPSSSSSSSACSTCSIRTSSAWHRSTRKAATPWSMTATAPS